MAPPANRQVAEVNSVKFEVVQSVAETRCARSILIFEGYGGYHLSYNCLGPSSIDDTVASVRKSPMSIHPTVEVHCSGSDV